MFNYRITRVHAGAVFKYALVIGLIIGGSFGLLLGLAARSLLGIFEGLFLGFVYGLVNAIVAAIYAILFNLFASSLNGIEIELTRKDLFLEELSQPIPLVAQSDQTTLLPRNAPPSGTENHNH